jgi:mono/diheme cytochrome c family protein
MENNEDRLSVKIQVLLLVSALLFLAAVVVVIARDSRREWKTFQKRYLDLPFWDFINPRLKPRALSTPEIGDDFHFTRAEKTDLCVTCHLGCEEDDSRALNEMPFKKHSLPKLCVLESSSHPAERFGCTACHLGQGRALSFRSAAHTPAADSQAMAWRAQYNHRPEPVERFRMLPRRFTQAGCLACHRHRLTVPRAELLNRGGELYYEYGCHGCHVMEFSKNMRKTGPTLRGLSRKLGREWARTFMDSPQKVKPESRMPDFFYLSNSAGASLEALEIEAMLAYLYDDTLALPAGPAPKGRAVKGQRLFENIGCQGCHTIDSARVPPARNLRGTGRKLGPEWIFAWLRNPKAIDPAAAMPNLRLSSGQAADMTAFLLAQRQSPKGLDLLPSPAPGNRVDKLLKERLAESPQEVPPALTQEQKMRLLGEKTIRFYGCAGCHIVRGMESGSPVGSDLDLEGQKDLDDFDFGALAGKIPAERFSYFRQVLEDPRRFDTGLDKKLNDLRRMPRYRLDRAGNDALVCFLLAQRQISADASIRVPETALDSAFRRGESLMLENRCSGCHVLFRHGTPRWGAIREYIADSTLGPPMLLLEGRKVKSDWLFSFLDSVTALRPWLSVRMPSFGFTADTLDFLVRHFAAEAGSSSVLDYFDPTRVSKKSVMLGKRIFNDFKCQACHVKKGFTPKRPRDQWSTDIALTPQRMRMEWFMQWLKDPQTWVPGTKMPNYFYDYDDDEKVFEPLIPEPDRAMAALRDYLYTSAF